MTKSSSPRSVSTLTGPSLENPRINQEHIRNFCIIAHIDHGKSTLADRLLEATGTVDSRQMRDQLLDQMDLERERGITIKMAPVRLRYHTQNGQTCELNLIDTPGHVDFSYEVSRSLAACEGALLVVDAIQGIEAQTIANVNLALQHNMKIIPVINKIDLPAADPERVKQEIEKTLLMDPGECLLASAKEGIGIVQILEAIVEKIPPPQGLVKAPLRCLIFDSHFDPYLGIIAYVRVVDGCLRPGIRLLMMASGLQAEVSGVGVFSPQRRSSTELGAGQVGFVYAGLKAVSKCRVGDTLTNANCPASNPLPGYRQVKPMVFSGLYPADGDRFHELREALVKLQLNDAALSFEPESSAALGFGFRCGFLGLLHSEIVQERLEREFDLDLVATCPSVVYRLTLTNGKTLDIDNPSRWPGAGDISKIEEPYILATILTPTQHLGACMELCTDLRGIFRSLEHSGPNRVVLVYELPLSEILMKFFDNLKSRSRGYASLDYEFVGYRTGDLVRLDTRINGTLVDPLSFITPRDKAYLKGKELVRQLKEILPRQLFEVRIQASLGQKVISAERLAPLRKNVVAKCYGGDVTRKRKLLEKQKAGKRRLKAIGRIEIPQEAFLSILRLDR